MPELDEKKRIIDYNTVNDPDENYYALIDNGTAGTGKVSIKGLGPANMISDAYSDQDTYAVGDVCIHNNILYVCNTEIDTPHAFDLSEWDPDTLGNYCSKLNGDVTEIKSSLSNYTNYIYNEVLIGKRQGYNLYRRRMDFSNIQCATGTEVSLGTNVLPSGALNPTISDKSFIKMGNTEQIFSPNNMYFITYFIGRNAYFRQGFSSSQTWSLVLFVEYALPA